MINGVEVRVAFEGDEARAMGLLAEELAALGYGSKKHADGSLEMKFDGKWLTTDPAKMKHKVTVTSEGGQLRFAFSTGLIASTWSDDDRAWAQRRADDAMAAVQAKL